MPIVRYECSTYEDFKKKIEDLTGASKDSKIYCLFTGKKDESGKSWCPDCVVAEPVIEEALKKRQGEEETVHFVTIEIPRDVHKDLNNPYRSDKQIQLRYVPTLLRWGGNQRLDNDITDSLIDMVFE